MPAARKRSADTDKPTNRREHGQHRQRHPHRFWRLVRRMRVMAVGLMLFLLRVTFMFQAMLVAGKSLLTPERHRHQARHVERGAGRRNRPNQPNQPAEWNLGRRGSVPKYLVL